MNTLSKILIHLSWLICGPTFATDELTRMPCLQALVDRQGQLQLGKDRRREMTEYNDLIFSPGQVDVRVSHTHQFFSRMLGPGDRDLERLIDVMVAQRRRPIHWVDVGGGFGLVLREIKRLDSGRGASRVHTTLVDLFDWTVKPDIHSEMSLAAQRVGSDIWNHQFAPQIALGDATTIRFTSPADLITSVESIQYIEDKIAAISNWYNQLNDEGLLIIATEHKWPQGILRGQKREFFRVTDSAFGRFLETLAQGKIKFALRFAFGVWPQTIQDLKHSDVVVIEKRKGTQIVPRLPFHGVWTNREGYSFSYYGDADSRASPIEVIQDSNR